MNRFFLVFIIISALLFSVSCNGGSSDKCDPGYTWDGTECKKDEVKNPDDNNIIPDNDNKQDNDPNESDIETDDDEAADDENLYTGDCIEVKKGGALEINIETKILTIGEITLNGNSDNTNLQGELWGENRTTLSEFKIADIDATLSGKKFKLPKGRYSFSYKTVSSDNRINILEDIDMASGDRTLDFDLPLFHFTGSVLKNSGAFSVEAGHEDSTKIKLKSGTHELIIPYADFASFDVVIPKGKYSVYFEGQLAAGQGTFRGTVISSNDGIVVEDDINQNINVETVTFSGNAVNHGYDVQTGQIVIVEAPPFDNISSVIIPDLASKAYSVTMTRGASMNVLFLPETDSYPVKYIRIETWDDLSVSKSHNIILDFGRVFGTVTFLGGTNLPSISKCTGADCTIGKLKAVGFDYSSLVVKDFKTNGADLTYEALLVRRTATNDAETPYISRKYNMVFESHLNNVTGAFKYSPFSVPLKYLNADNAMVSTFTIQNVAEEYLMEKEINFNIAPMMVEGTVTLNGTAITTDKEDLIKLRDENGIETPVVNISELTDGTFSFLVPAGEYEVIYEGEGVLGTYYRTHLEKNFNVNGNLTGQTFSMTSAKINIGVTVNGVNFKEWLENNKNIDGQNIVINPDKTAANYTIDTVKQTDGPYYAEVLTGTTINGYLDLYFVNSHKTDRSFLRIPLLVSHSMGSDTTVNFALKLTEYSTSVKLNGGNVTGASGHIANLRIQGQNRTEVFYPASGTESVKAIFKSGEHKSPGPEIILNDGFDTKQAVQLECLYFGE